MTTADQHINELLSAENLALKERLELAESCYADLVEAIETHLADYIVDDDVAAVAIYCDAIRRVGKAIPHWTFLHTKVYPTEGEWVIVAFVKEVNGEYETCEAIWADGTWGTNYSCLELTDNVYAWTKWIAPPPFEDE